jgi:hypothetical protein
VWLHTITKDQKRVVSQLRKWRLFKDGSVGNLSSPIVFGAPSWTFFAVVNYDALRVAAKHSFVEQTGLARAYVSKLQKAQRAAEKALDMSALIANSLNFC